MSNVTPFLENHLLFSCGDHPGKLSFVTYTDVLCCNMNCMDCHNKETSKKLKETLTYLSFEDFEKNLINGQLMGCDLLVISGGEPTLKTDELINVLLKINNKIPIRIDTNGQLPSEVARLYKYVSGFAIDIKIPIKNKYTKEEECRFCKILGIPDVYKYADNINKSVNISDGMDMSLFRTVQYPLLNTDDIHCINEYTKKLKSPHYWNPFLKLSDLSQ